MFSTHENPSGQGRKPLRKQGRNEIPLGNPWANSHNTIKVDLPGLTNLDVPANLAQVPHVGQSS